MIAGLLLLNPMLVIFAQGHVFAMEISSGEEFYIACDNTGTPLAVFSNNGLLLKQVCMLVLPEQKASACDFIHQNCRVSPYLMQLIDLCVSV